VQRRGGMTVRAATETKATRARDPSARFLLLLHQCIATAFLPCPGVLWKRCSL